MSEPVAGKFLLEILTKGMYSNPMHIYREYIQNATDAIDAAVQAGLIQMQQAVIHITVSAKKRSIIIRDNGTGISSVVAVTRLLNVGASDKDIIADRLSAAPQKISSMGLDRNECLHYNKFIFELNIYITHISFSRYIADCGENPWAVFCICFFLSYT